MEGRPTFLYNRFNGYQSKRRDFGVKGLYGRRGFETLLKGREDRALEADEVRVRVLACGVCGTDLHFLRERDEFTPLGHEICGEVVEAGSAAGEALLGQRVAVEDVSMCGGCAACKAGQVELCREGLTLGGQPGMSDELIVHRRMLNAVGDLDPVAACMTEPLAVAVRCVEKLRPEAMGSLLIYGMGAIGLFCAAYARFLGAGRIAMAGRRGDTARGRAADAAARALGADEVQWREDGDGPDGAPGKDAFDAAIVAAPPALCAEALGRVRYGGKVLACGITLGSDGFANIDVNDMVMNKKQLLSVLAEPAIGFPLAVRLIAEGAVDARRAVTHTLPLSQAGRLRDLYGRDAPALKTVILPGNG